MQPEEKPPSNVIIKTSYGFTKRLLENNYFNSIIEEIMNYIKLHKNYDCLEIEAKLGRFDFKGEGVKILERISETFIIPDNIKESKTLNKYFFIAGVPQVNFFLIWSALDKESIIDPNIQCLKPQTYTDTLYKTNKRRSLIYQDGQLLKEEIIRKENKKHINVRNRGYDFRITCSEEMPTEIDSNFDQKDNERDKFRVSYQFSFYRVDLTISKDEKSNDYSYEVEIELNKLKYDLQKEKIDENRIRTILNRFVQNIMNLYSVLLPDAIYNNHKHEESLKYNINANSLPKGIQSKFGNYFKNNLFPNQKK